MDVDALLITLGSDAGPISDLEAPSAPGVYALFLTPGARVPGVAQPGNGPLYIGLSSNLAQREFDTHFAAGKSGFSTLRRSLGALLLGQLDLKPVPRGRGTSDSNYRNYRFEMEGEHRLSAWMETNLRVAVHAVRNPKAIEPDLIRAACPPLNLTHWANPDAPALKGARAACVAAARGGRAH